VVVAGVGWGRIHGSSEGSVRTMVFVGGGFRCRCLWEVFGGDSGSGGLGSVSSVC
jgi:hypothetical protein